ncbi:monooxygenase [Pseudomonas tohonis]|uniref:Monooxygenase n=1 Tax=Pseudomonas tohonis TaxID=2725477 RepID=A0A6J4E4W1_9PSED|nr:FAD-dependent monooxygenase [Pseudomonas tohonis]BCG24650.1 monooxygenase [Pseudomonas tohonis]GJN51991.1 monooxygenase [Pseudomonas tohonis]
MIDVPVLISGGGPVGLTLALALSRLGIRSLLINDRQETTRHPKLDVVNCRSMEIFRQLGLAQKIRAAGNPTHANQYSAMAASASGPFYTVMRDRHLIYQPVDRAEAVIRACDDGSLPLESMQRIAQMNLEPVLLAEAQADPNIEVRFGWRLYGFEQGSTGVIAMAQQVDSGETLQVFAQYLIGCDGPNSRVRNFLNIDYDGTRDLVGELFIIHLRSDEIAALYPDNQPYWHTWLTRPGYGGLLVSPDAGRNDYVLHRPFAPRPGETLESVIDAALGQKLKYQIVQSGPWRPQFLVARSFGRQRVFIAGDATHQFMPTGGLGMNTGVTEAHNLAWKLAACLQGWGGAKLLESYEAERLPVARRNRDHVKKCAAGAFEAQFEVSEALLDEGPAGEQARASIARAFEAKVSRMYESLGVEIGYRYHGSPVMAVDTEAEPEYDELHYRPTTWTGSRLPSAFRADGTAVFDQLGYDRFTLLALGADEGEIAALCEAAAECRVPLAVLRLDEPHLARLYPRRLLLVRPDQHVCWRGDSLPDDCHRLFNLIRGAR